MTDKYKNKYRIPSARLQHWDYGSNAAYFVTICTKNKECCFGDITGGVLVMTELGKTVETEWIKSFEMRPDMNLQMGAYVVMPNHFHAIIIIGENKYNMKHGVEYASDDASVCRDAMHCVSTDSDPDSIPKNRFAPQSKNLASVIRGFKIGVTKYARLNAIDFDWQTRYHDHIIRNDKSYKRITDYIINNPLNWAGDTFYQYNA